MSSPQDSSKSNFGAHTEIVPPDVVCSRVFYLFFFGGGATLQGMRDLSSQMGECLVSGPWCLDQGSNPFHAPSPPDVQWKGGVFNHWIVQKLPGTLTSCFKPFVTIHGQGFLVFAYVCISKENLFLSNMFYEMLNVGSIY